MNFLDSDTISSDALRNINIFETLINTSILGNYDIFRFQINNEKFD